jgi:transcriptional regulator with XRE-family HTH domain
MLLRLRTKSVLTIDHVATGEVARILRKRCRKSLRSVAKKLKVSAAYLSDLELGKRNWNAERLIQFEKALR